jgi:RNA polymerase sigma factor (sigma-70 family)
MLRRFTRGLLAQTLDAQTDRQLVEQFLVRRDEAVFEVLLRRHGPMVYRVCWRVLQQAQDTEDAFQATFLLLAQKLRMLRKSDSLASWLHGVARRVALKARAQTAARQRRERRTARPLAMLSEDITWSELRTLLDAELAGLSSLDSASAATALASLAHRALRTGSSIGGNPPGTTARVGIQNRRR